MFYKIVLNFIFISALSILQISFITALPGWFNEINLLIIALVFVLVLSDFKLAFFWSLGFGFFLDVYSFNFFGVHLLTFFSVLLITNFLLNNFFTNRSLYSFSVLIFLSTLLFKTILYLIAYLFNFFNFIYLSAFLNLDFWFNTLIEIILNLLITFILFYLVNFIGQKLKPVFLVKKNF